MMDAIRAVLICSTPIVTLLNMYCVVIMVYSKRFHNRSDMTIFSLLLGHLLQGILVMPFYIAKRGANAHAAVCDIFRFSYLFTNYVCCLSVLVITTDRFIGCSFPFRYKSLLSSHRLGKILVGVWIYVLGLCLIPLFSPGEHCHYNPQPWWVLTMIFVNTFIPFVIVIIFYILIFKRIKDAITKRQKLSETMESKDLLKKIEKTTKIQIGRTKIAFFIVAAYVLCWGPSFVYNLLITICRHKCFQHGYHDSEAEEIAGFVTKLLTFIDGLTAPTIYCCLNKNFNKTRQRVIASIRKKVSGSHEIFRSFQTNDSGGIDEVFTESPIEIDEKRPFRRAKYYCKRK